MTLQATDGVLLALVLPAAGLSVVAGAAKLRHPAAAAKQLVTALGLPAPTRALPAAGVVLGAAEVLLGLAPLAGAVGLALLGLAYLVYTAGMLVMLRRQAAGRVVSCGCFGVADVPPSRLHLGVDAVLAVACLVGAVALGAPSATQAVLGVPALVAGTYLLRAVLVELPLLRQAAAGTAPRTFRVTAPAPLPLEVL